jgi:hypothetical protein
MGNQFACEMDPDIVADSGGKRLRPREQEEEEEKTMVAEDLMRIRAMGRMLRADSPPDDADMFLHHLELDVQLGSLSNLHALNVQVFMTPVTHEFVLAYINTTPLGERFRGTGLGRAVINMLQQTIALSSRLPQILVARKCYFPTFYVTDSHYHWTTRSKVAIPPKTPPNLIYPRWLDLNQHAPGNKEAIYRYVDLVWHPPAHVHVQRCDRAGLDDSNLAITWAHNMREFMYRPFGETKWITRYGVCIALRRMSEVLPSEVGRIGQACLLLGNDDTGKDTPNDVAVIHLGQYIENGTQTNLALAKPLVALLMLCYLVDMARVLYRPIVISRPAIDQFLALNDAGKLADFLAASPLVPRPVPYFITMGEVYVHVPRKKPHSTSSYDGVDHIPLPELEPPLAFEQLTEPPSKRIRTSSCVACGMQTATMTDRLHYYCDAKCQRDYYDAASADTRLPALLPPCAACGQLVGHLQGRVFCVEESLHCACDAEACVRKVRARVEVAAQSVNQ